MNNNPVIKLLKRLTIFLVILVVNDRLIGRGLEVLFYKQKHGDNYVSIYLLDKATEDVLILGGSRASHNFNAAIIENGVNMSCFNGGRDEMTINYTAAVLPIVYKKSTPKVIIIDIVPGELSLNKDVNQKYERIASVLMPFCHRYPELMNTVDLAGNNTLLKMKVSHIYPYNSTIGSSLQNTYSHLGHISVKGYEPLNGAIDSQTYKKSLWGNLSEKNASLDSISISDLTSVIRLTKDHGTRLIAIISPFYFSIDFYRSNSYLAFRKLLEDNQCELYDFSHDPEFLLKPSLFYDDLHLNVQGSTLFTKSIIHLIKNKTAK